MFYSQNSLGYSDDQGEFDVETIITVNHNFYIDDCLKSVYWTDKAVCFSGQLRELLSRGGFQLKKVISNDRNEIATVSLKERVPSVVTLDLEHLHVEHTLGLQWEMETDNFNFPIMDEEKALTHRGIHPQKPRGSKWQQGKVETAGKKLVEKS